jgi:hypothetical protein
VRWLSVLVASLVLLVAGCGGGSNESAATTETTTTAAETTTTESTATTEEMTTDTSGSTSQGTFNWASEDCQNMVKAFVGLSTAVGAASSGQDVSPDIEQFSKYVDEVPEEIRADVKTIAGAYDEFVSKLKDIGYTPGQVPTADQIQQLQDASKSIDDPAVKAASDRLTAWTSKNCT